MARYMYIVNDLVFTSQEGKYNGHQRAKSYCRKHNIDEEKILEVRTDTELEYCKLLITKGVKFLGTHEKVLGQQGFHNSIDDFIPPVLLDIPFHYADEEGVHYEWVVGSVYDLNTNLVDSKMMFDKTNAQNNHYLKLIYLDTDGTFKEFKINEIEQLRKKYQLAKHKQVLNARRKLREIQTFERLRQLRNEGRITEKQTQELYRLEALYGKAT